MERDLKAGETGDDLPLVGVRVVDAAENIAGPYAARLLGDLGAEVVKLETPSGDRLRCRGPFPDERRHPDESAMFHLLNAGKRGLVVDPGAADAEAHIGALLKDCDLVVTSEGSAFCELVWERRKVLAGRHPGLILGNTLPVPRSSGAARHTETSLHAAALGGVSAVIGEPHRSPLPPPYDILDYVAGANLAGALLVAFFARTVGSRGQAVEVVTSEMAAHYVLTPRINDLISRSSRYTRSGRRSPGAMGGIYPWGLYPCADGLVTIVSHARRNWQTLLSMLGDPAWAKDPRFEDPLEIARNCPDEVDELLGRELKRYTRAELFQLAVANAFALGPVLTTVDVLGSDHLAARDSLSTIDVGDRRVRYIKRPWILSETPIPKESTPAPRLGDCEGRELTWSDRCNAASSPHEWRGAMSGATGAGPLAGIRVIDFSWNWAGPMVGAAFADMGAEVIRVEHRGRLDNSRLRARPSVNGQPVEGPLEEVSYYFHQNNRGKLGTTFDIKDRQGAQIVAELMQRADLVLENFTPGVFARTGLDFNTIRKANPQLVWLSMTSAGQTGPLAGIRTYAPIMSALAGLESLAGYEGEHPVGMLGYSYGDVNGGAHAIVVALAALHSARTTGKGQFIDFSLTETQMSVLMEPMAELELGKAVPGSQGMRHSSLCPYGHYRCAGEDRWLALSIGTEEEWKRLAGLIEFSGLAKDKAVCDLEWRKRHRQRIDVAIEGWTSVRDRDEAVAALIRAGLPAAPVLSSDEVVRDWPDKGYFVLPHPVTGDDRVLPVPWHMSATPPRPPRPAPMVGEHTRFVLERILNRSRAEADALLAMAATR